MLALILAVNGLTVLGLLLTVRRARASGRPLRPDERPLTRAEMRRHLIAGLVYSNPDDPRGWVPKSRGYGWTVNFRTPAEARRMIAFLVITLASTIATVAYSLLTQPRH